MSISKLFILKGGMYMV